MAEELKAVIIGCGPRAHEYATALQKAAGVACAACADLNRERADAFAAEYGLRPYYEAMEMLEVEAPDLLAIVTDEVSRAKLTRMCVEKRVLAVIVERPLARTLSVAQGLVEVCHANHTLLTVVDRSTRARAEEPLRLRIEAVCQTVLHHRDSALPLPDGLLRAEDLLPEAE